MEGFFTYSLALVGFLNIFLGVFVYAFNRAKKVNVYFSLMITSLGLWPIGLALYYSFDSVDATLNSARMYYIAAALIGLFTLFFSYAFARNQELPKRFRYSILAITLIECLLIAFVPNYLLKDVVFYEDGTKEVVLGAAEYVIYSVLFLGSYYTGLYFLTRAFLNEEKGSNRRLNLLITLLALFVAVLFGAWFNLFLPWIGNYNLIWVGPQFTTITVLLIIYGIARYQLFDVRILVGRLIYIFMMSVIPLAIFFAVAWIDITLFQSIFDWRVLVLNYIFAILFVLLYDAVNNYIRNSVESNIINPGFDPKNSITKLNRAVSSELDKISIANEVISTLAKTIRASFEVIALEYKDEVVQFYQSSKNEIEEHKLQDIFRKWKLSLRKTFITDQFFLDDQSREKHYTNIDIHIAEELRDAGIKVIMPLKQSEDILGVIMLGNKDGDTPYNSIELEYIDNVADTLALAMARSFLYEEVKDFNVNLQEQVEEATSELRKTNTRLEEALRKERDMMDVIGHELRTPLGVARNAIILLEKLKKQGKLDSELGDKYMHMALENIKREKDLLQTILQSARLEHDRIQMNEEKVSFHDVIEDTLTAFQDKAEEKGLKVTVTAPEEETFIIVDRTIIQQIIDNLVSNAVKYTFEGTINIVLEDHEEDVIFKVIDTGEGISDEDLRNIGKKFFRAKSNLDSMGKIGGREIVRPGGTGIGVYVIKGLLRQLDSKLEIESVVDKGSTFQFKLKKDRRKH